MNKTKMILAGTGGAIGLVVLALGFLVWQAFSAKTAAIEGDDEEGVEGLETVLSRAQSLSRKSVYPCEASVKAIEANQKAVDDWCKEGLSLAARGDRICEKTTAPKFKTFLIADAKRLAALPGAVNGKLVRRDFAFGPFKDYITEGKMPSETELVELQRKWDDVALITELFATNGVAELVDVGFANVNKEEGAGKREQGRGNREQGRGKKKAAEAKNLPHEPRSFSYVFTFTVRPAAFISVLNGLEACERFIVVDDFSFCRPGDVIAEALGVDEKKPEEAQASGGRRGRRVRRGGGEPTAAAPAEKEAAASKNGIVTDPVLDAPMVVTMNVTVHDFRSLEEPEETVSVSQQKGASK